MYKLNFLIILLIFLNIKCSGNNDSVIKLGRVFDNTKTEVSDETDIFKRNENFAYTLSQKEPFNTEIITRRFYQGKEYIDMIRKENIDIKIIPGTKKIGESIPVEKLVQKFGSGNYLLLFAINESVIAKKSFFIEGNVLKTGKTSDGQVNGQIMPARTEKNMPKPNMYKTNEAAVNDKINPAKDEKYVPNPEQKRDEVPFQRREKINLPSPSEMMNDNK